MVDTLASQDAAQTPAETPVIEPAVDIEAVTAQVRQALAAENEERVKGFQRALADKDKEIRNLKTATLSDDERSALAVQEAERERDEARREASLLKLRAQYAPEVVTAFEALTSLNTPEEQVAFIANLRAPSTPAAPAPEPDADLDVRDATPARPAATSQTIQGTPASDGSGRVWNGETGEAYLRKISVWGQ